MEDQLLQKIATDINVIKWLLISLAVVFVSIFVAAVIFLVMLAKMLARDLPSRPGYRAKGRALLDQGALEELQVHAQDKLDENPDHEYGNYFLALYHYRKGNIHDAYRVFKRLREINPTWGEEYIDPYLTELEEKIKNSKPEIIK
jgi:hypothetical protein